MGGRMRHEQAAGQAARPLAASDDLVAGPSSESTEPADLTELRPSPAFAPRWANRFRIVPREELPTAANEKKDSMVAPEPNGSDWWPCPDGQHVLDAGQLERDIADIRAQRDRLSWEASHKAGRKERRFAAVKTSDCVPILVGGMLAFAALVVFGAAASFVSFR